MENDNVRNQLKDIIGRCRRKDCLGRKPANLADKMTGALYGRFAGCLLGVPVENHSIENMTELAGKNGTSFPPTDYWTNVDNPDGIQYGISKRTEYTKGGMTCVAVDDDITYTILNLLLLEKYGENYTVDDVGKLWLDILPYACTAEDEALKQLKEGTEPMHAADFNDYVEWIGAAIRADAFGYACAGFPGKAARLCYNDAYLTHRKNGIYGEMLCAAAVSAAFTSKTPLDAIKIGKKFIPIGCELDLALDWALSYEGKIKDYLHARELLDKKFADMNCVHIINNMCALTFGLMLGGSDFTAIISNTVAIGLDNDCTGATAGSIAGACLGAQNIPQYWYKNFNDKVLTYLKGYPQLSINDVAKRFEALNK